MAARPPSPSAPLSERWAYIEDGLRAMMTAGNAGEYRKYMELYAAAQNYCTSDRVDEVGGSEEEGLAGRTGLSLMGADLHSKITRFYKDHLEELRATASGLVSNALLTYYATWWDRYTGAVPYVDRLFTHLNRNWVKRERDEGKRDVHTVRELVMTLWNESFLARIQPSLSEAFLHEIERQGQGARDAETADEAVVRKVADSLLSPGLDFAEKDAVRAAYELYCNRRTTQ